MHCQHSSVYGSYDESSVLSQIKPDMRWQCKIYLQEPSYAVHPWARYV